MKKFNTLFITLGLLYLLALPAASAANNNLTILLNGAPIDASQAYISDSGSTMIPLRTVMEAMGCDVAWDAATRTIAITSPQTAGAPSEPDKSPLVVLDPGHGGDNNGAEYGGIKEKDLNLAIALQTAQLLEAEGVSVRLTRETDQSLGLYERTEFANNLNAALFVSVHCNANVEHDDALGIYTCAYSAGTPGWTLAELLHDAMIAASGAEDFSMEERPNLAVLRTSKMPAALVECGFMSTESELANLIRPEYQAKLARGIADGILAYLAQ